ncbi:MAG TPA: hypothetical protein VGM77_07820 [Gemmatimonadales bacterium]|jgi:hypothetical protein
MPRVHPAVVGVSSALVLFAACGHSDAFDRASERLGPISSGPDIQLTFNSDQDYWPSWTEDGSGILYAFVRPGTNVRHRCVGLLPAKGGTQSWTLCDDRFGSADSTNSFPAYALGADGRLLYLESQSRNNSTPTPVLWLADSAQPFRRTAVATFPISFSSGLYNWLGDLKWTGPNSFVGLAQAWNTAPHTFQSFLQDTLLANIRGVVISGTIAGGRATLAPVPGTDGATGYSLAEGGASIIFTTLADAALHRVPVAGGTPTTVATIPTSNQLVGVTCKGGTCIVADAPVAISADQGGGVLPGPRDLRTVSISTGATTLLSGTDVFYSSPQWAPTSNDIVVQVGGTVAHLETTYSIASDLHLLVNLAP